MVYEPSRTLRAGGARVTATAAAPEADHVSARFRASTAAMIVYPQAAAFSNPTVDHNVGLKVSALRPGV